MYKCITPNTRCMKQPASDAWAITSEQYSTHGTTIRSNKNTRSINLLATCEVVPGHSGQRPGTLCRSIPRSIQSRKQAVHSTFESRHPPDSATEEAKSSSYCPSHNEGNVPASLPSRRNSLSTPSCLRHLPRSSCCLSVDTRSLITITRRLSVDITLYQQKFSLIETLR
ncbi:hypothetical protein BDZ45DRAFT_169327 [Acephala macrosclerotiorum]|nr:hypothetical protein BDZ45DRAFT_169327 [Acephala macrosclerotiorum]